MRDYYSNLPNILRETLHNLSKYYPFDNLPFLAPHSDRVVSHYINGSLLWLTTENFRLFTVGFTKLRKIIIILPAAVNNGRIRLNSICNARIRRKVCLRNKIHAKILLLFIVLLLYWCWKVYIEVGIKFRGSCCNIGRENFRMSLPLTCFHSRNIAYNLGWD